MRTQSDRSVGRRHARVKEAGEAGGGWRVYLSVEAYEVAWGRTMRGCESHKRTVGDRRERESDVEHGAIFRYPIDQWYCRVLPAVIEITTRVSVDHAADEYLSI